MRFASHRDIARAVERGTRLAGLPVAYSAGFSPHPRISYPGGAPTGAASEAEYFEISLTGACLPADVATRLDAALPDGIDVIEVVEVDSKSAVLRPEASQWEVRWPGVNPRDAAAAVQALLDAPGVEVERLTSKGIRRFDVRPAVASIQVSGGDADSSCPGDAIIRMVVLHQALAVRPDDVLAALRSLAPVAPSSPAMATRLWQGQLDDADAPGTAACPPAPPGAGGPAMHIKESAGTPAGAPR
jgi:radical SAM-linked protein